MKNGSGRLANLFLAINIPEFIPSMISGRKLYNNLYMVGSDLSSPFSLLSEQIKDLDDIVL